MKNINLVDADYAKFEQRLAAMIQSSRATYVRIKLVRLWYNNGHKLHNNLFTNEWRYM